MAEPKIITYPIPGNAKGGLLHIHGSKPSKNVILCCGGYPDDHQPFTPLARRLASEEGCFVGITCFPGFDLDSYNEMKFSGYKRSGYNFDEVCASIREAVSQLFDQWKSDSSKDEGTTSPKFTIILHDWGVVPGLMFVNRSIEEHSPYTPHKIVLLDVLTMPHKDYNDIPKQQDVPYPLRMSAYELAVAASYRFAFASSFVLLRFVSEIVGLINYAILYNVLLLLRLNPTYGFDKQYAYDERVARAKTPLAFYYHLVYMCYPYYYMFKCLIQQKGFEDIHIPLDLKATPILYIYGKAKNINFHDWKSLAILEREEREKRSDCRVVAVEGAGHWMYVQKLDVCFDEIRSFIR